VDISIIVFAIMLLGTFAVAILGRRDSKQVASATLSEQRLNRWLVGLSAGATANSGFVVTAAVGLGYSFGAQWLLLPLSWLLGDVIFWLVFPQRINATGRAIKATTMTDVIVNGIRPQLKAGLKRIIAVLILVCLGGYVSAQWLAGQKFLGGAFGFDGVVSLLVFAALIVIYTAIGGFRGSVYVDSMQAIIRVIGTVIAMATVAIVASRDSTAFWQNIKAAGPDFLRIFPHGLVLAGLPVIIGFAGGCSRLRVGPAANGNALFGWCDAGRNPLRMVDLQLIRTVHVDFHDGVWFGAARCDALNCRPGERIESILPGKHWTVLHWNNLGGHLRDNCRDLKQPAGCNGSDYCVRLVRPRTGETPTPGGTVAIHSDHWRFHHVFVSESA
jgi:hypothetical protein